MANGAKMADGEFYPGQFDKLKPLPEWHGVSHLPGVERADYRGFMLEIRRSAGPDHIGLINGSVREWHDERPYLRFLLLTEAARLAEKRDAIT